MLVTYKGKITRYPTNSADNGKDKQNHIVQVAKLLATTKKLDILWKNQLAA